LAVTGDAAPRLPDAGASAGDDCAQPMFGVQQFS
jgi:hypothetical protein